MYFSFYKNYSKIFQGILENPWKILEILKYSSLALIDTSLENVRLDIALRFKVFQGQLKFSLEIFGLPSTLKILEIFEKGHLDLELTLNFKVNFKDPWNSRLRFPSLVQTVCFISVRNSEGHVVSQHHVINLVLFYVWGGKKMETLCRPPRLETSSPPTRPPPPSPSGSGLLPTRAPTPPSKFCESPRSLRVPGASRGNLNPRSSSPRLTKRLVQILASFVYWHF